MTRHNIDSASTHFTNSEVVIFVKYEINIAFPFSQHISTSTTSVQHHIGSGNQRIQTILSRYSLNTGCRYQCQVYRHGSEHFQLNSNIFDRYNNQCWHDNFPLSEWHRSKFCYLKRRYIIHSVPKTGSITAVWQQDSCQQHLEHCSLYVVKDIISFTTFHLECSRCCWITILLWL